MPELELKEKMNEIADGIVAVQEKQKSLEKKYDGLDLDAMKKAAEDASKGLLAIQELEQKIKADELMERIFSIESAVVEVGKGKKTDETDPLHKASFYSYLRKGVNIPKETVQAYCEDVANKTLLHADPDKVKAYVKDLVEGSNPDGGFFITPERSTQIIRRVFETSPLRLVANVTTTSSDSMEFVIDDNEADAGWVGETQTRADTNTPEIGLKTIPVHELYAQPKATQRMLDDAGFDLEGWLQGKVTRKFSRLENYAGVLGDGSKKWRGFLTYSAWSSAGVYQRDAIEQIAATGTAGTLDEPDDLINLQCALIDDYQASAVWTGTRSTFCDIMKLKDTAGQYLLNPMVLREGGDRILLGKRFIIMADMPEVAANALSVAYGDFGEGYTIVDRFGIRVLRDPYTSKPYVKFYSTKRSGGDVTNFEAIKILKINAS
jgi:HK97 family phage major capsid protein